MAGTCWYVLSCRVIIVFLSEAGWLYSGFLPVFSCGFLHVLRLFEWPSRQGQHINHQAHVQNHLAMTVKAPELFLGYPEPGFA